jgi:rod shape-determining protein MreD
MIARKLSRRGAQPLARRISQAPSPFVAYATPWAAVALASIMPCWPLVAMAPIMPPLGFMSLLAWRQVRPGLLPIWAGLPLGLVDDLFSGQPFGCAIFLWTLTLITLEIIEARFPWRNFITDWLVASLFLLAYLAACVGFNQHGVPADIMPPWAYIGVQMGLTVIAYPMVGRVVGWIDRWRLTRFRVVG